MSEASERADFAREYAGEPVELVVLTSDPATSGSHYPPEILWTGAADLLAHRFVVAPPGLAGAQEGGRLRWLYAEDDDDTKPDLRPLTTYRVRGQAATSRPGSFSLLEVIEQTHDAEMAGLVARQQAPVVVESRWGAFTLDRSVDLFRGRVDWVQDDIFVTLEPDDLNTDAPECQAALAVLDRLLPEAATLDAAWRAKAAADLIESALEWSEDDSPQLSATELAQRFTLSELEVAGGGELTAFFGDGDVFAGHAVQLEVEPDGSLGEAHLAG